MGKEEDGMDIFLKMDLVILKMGGGEIQLRSFGDKNQVLNSQKSQDLRNMGYGLGGGSPKKPKLTTKIENIKKIGT